MLFKALSAAVYGIDANIIDVEVDFSGIQMKEDQFHTVGLPDAAVRESRDRILRRKARALTCQLRSAFLALMAPCSSKISASSCWSAS
jgi:hypothetical protein